MNMAQALLAEFKQEMAATRTCLERIPDEKLNWQPHPKSMTMAGLAAHMANLPSWTGFTLEQDEFDLQASPPAPEEIKSTAGALEQFDQSVTAACTALEKASDEQFMETWTLKSGEQTILAMPKGTVLRSFVMSHMVHHRAQLGVYLRLNDVPVPSVYGPSADENPFG